MRSLEQPSLRATQMLTVHSSAELSQNSNSGPENEVTTKGQIQFSSLQVKTTLPRRTREAGNSRSSEIPDTAHFTDTAPQAQADMGMEGAPVDQQPAQQDAAVPDACTPTADTLLLDAQIAEGLNNIDVIRCCCCCVLAGSKASPRSHLLHMSHRLAQ